MSHTPSFNVFLKDELSEQERKDVLSQLRRIDGVLSAEFNAAVKPPQSAIEVTYHTFHVIKNPVNEAQRIPGVKQIKHYDW